MGKLRSNQDKKKISSQSIENRGSGCEQYPAFSFRYLTTNKKYNFEHFSDINNKMKMMGSLVDRMKEISEKPYTYWNGMGKIHGSETISFWQCNINPKELELPKDEKIIVFRFHKQNYRLLCIRIDKCPVLYVIGFDFDYSAYNHGS